MNVPTWIGLISEVGMRHTHSFIQAVAMSASFGSSLWGSRQAHGAKKVNTTEAPMTVIISQPEHPLFTQAVC